MRIFIRTSKTGEIQHYINTYSICSVARPRLVRTVGQNLFGIFQSTRSQDRDHCGYFQAILIKHFNPLGRKTETIADICREFNVNISIHSVARPRRRRRNLPKSAKYFNPLGRKTETAQLNNY